MTDEMERVEDEYIVQILDNGMSATINLLPVNPDTVFSLEEIQQILADNGIKKGIDYEVITNMLVDRTYYQDIEVAKGKAAENGTNGYFTFNFRTSMPILPVINEDGTADYMNMELFEMVEKDQLIAEYHKATAGIFGFDVTGKLLRPKKGHDIPPLRGNGFHMSKDRTQYFASMTGKITTRGGIIDISRMYIVPGDLCTVDGNIRFDGDIMIEGDVLGGLTIEATGNIVIKGNVERSIIKAGKDIAIKKGMKGGRLGTVECGGILYGSFFESTDINAAGGINVNYLMDCTTSTGGKVESLGSRGAIIGGVTYALAGISAYSIGNRAEVKTKVVTGCTGDMIGEYENYGRNIIRIRSEIKTFKDGKEKLEKALTTEQLSAHPVYSKIVKALEMKEEELENNMKGRRELSEILYKKQNSAIIARGYIYPGVLVVIDARELTCRQKVRGVRFSLKDNHVAAYQL